MLLFWLFFGGFGFGLGFRFGNAAGSLFNRDSGVFLLEFLDSPFGIHQFLLAGEEWVAGGADINANVLFGRADLIGSAAGAGRGRIKVFRMYPFFHDI